MKLKLDLHVHTDSSEDAFTPMGQALETAERRGLDGLAITDHDKVLDFGFRSLKGEVIVIPGIELSTQHGHVLGLGVETWDASKPQSLIEAVQIIHERGGLAVLAHPYLSSLHIPRLIEISEVGFNALEAVNASAYLFWLSRKLALNTARRLSLPITAGSDSHIPETIGKAYTVIDSRSREVEDILDAIKNGRTEVFGHGLSLWHRLSKLNLQLRGSR